MSDEPTIEIIPPPPPVYPITPPVVDPESLPPPHLVTPPLTSDEPPHLVTPPLTSDVPPHLVTPPLPPSPLPGRSPSQLPPPPQLTPPPPLTLTPPPQLTPIPAINAVPPPNEKPAAPARRGAETSELDALLAMHMGNLGGPPRKLSVPDNSGIPNGQPSPVPLPPPLPQFPKIPSGSPKLQRAFTAERALTPPNADGETKRPPSPAHSSITEIQFNALKRDIKKGGGKSILHRLKHKDKDKEAKSISISSPTPVSSNLLGAPSTVPSAPLSPATPAPQPVPISKKKERQSFMFSSKPSNPAPFTIPVRISCVSADSDTSANKLVWEIEVQVGSKTKVSELWEKIKEHGHLNEQPETHALMKDDEILIEKEHLSKYKIKQNDVLKIRPRTKKFVKKQLNNLIARRPSQDELISRHIMAKVPETTVDSVPDVETIQRCVDFLVTTEAYKQEGLFRISAGAMNLKLFYDTFRKHEPDFTIIESCHTVAASIKQYFRGLPAGLMPLRVAIPMRDAFQKRGDTPELYAELAELVKQLPKPNLQVIDLVFRLVILVIKNHETSKMDDRNCSIVFAPNVFAFDTNMDLMKQSEIQTKLVHIFFLHYDAIFGPATSSLPPNTTVPNL